MLNIYKASAGSGKTYTLVKEYLRLAFASTAKYRHILAITFTNKAANEMKSRIIEALEGIAKGDAKYQSLSDELGAFHKKSEAAMSTMAGDILRSMLHNYSDISVSTIDSFVHRIVRSFAHDLHLPMSFDIEMDSNKLLAEAVNLMLDRLSETDTQITQAVVEFAESKIEEGGSWNVEFGIKSLGRELFVDDALPHIQKLSLVQFDDMRQARGALYAKVNAFEKKLFDEGKIAFSLIMSQGLTSKDFYQTDKGVFGYFNKYAQGVFPANVLGNSYVLKTIMENKWGGTKCSSSALASINSICGALEQHFKNINSIWEQEGKDYYLAKLLLKNFYSFILLADLQKLMDEIKKDSNVLYIGDFHHKVFEIVKEQDAPVIYERIGERYDNILIDEFQDTSVIQWRNLLPLIENSQFKNEDSLIVGDGKQAIYRFRGGEAEQFTMLPKIYGAEGDLILQEREVAIHNYGTNEVNLEKNWRSRKEVIDFNNLFYKEMLAMPELVNKVVYEDYFQQQGRSDDGGFVSIEFLQADVAEEQTINEVRCDRVKAIVEDSLARGYAYRDIAVLTRSNANASVIAAYLVQQGIKVVSPESLLIHYSPKVRLLLSVLGYLDRKDDHIARAEIMYYTCLLLGKEVKYEQIDFKTGSDEYELILENITGIYFRSAELQTGRLSDLVQQLIRVFGFEDDDPFVQFFADELLLYASRYGNGIGDFLIWWDGVKHKKSIIYPESIDAVRIMTIHKSKGLQFPIVILADASEKKKMNKNFFWVGLDKPWLPQLNMAILPVEKTVKETEFSALYEREDQQSFLDMLNLIYVGTTRPEDALYILSEHLEKDPTENNSVTALLINFLMKLERWDDYNTVSFGDAEYRKLGEGKNKSGPVYVKEKTTSKGLLASTIKVRMRADLLWSDETSGKIDKGNLLHEALKRVKYAGDEHQVVRNMRAEGWVEEADEAALLESVKQVIYHADMQAYYKRGLKVINERAVLKQGEKMHIPDRVVINKDGATIIDYKTGNPRPEHNAQLSTYARLLTEVGITVTKKILFYTAEQKALEF